MIDVAELAGVSKAVASIVLNNREDSNIRASQETSERIRQAARELGYLPNPAAQSLAGGKNRILGVFTFEPIFPLAQQNFYHPFLLGIEQEAEEQDYDLLLFTSARTGEKQRQRTIFRGGINRLGLADGAILLGREEDRTEVSQLISQRYPFVYLGRRVINGTEVPYVGTDYAAATAQIVRHLADLGHRDFAYLGSLGDHEAGSDRQAGYSRALSELSLAGGTSYQQRIQPAELTSDVLRGWLAAGISAFVVEDDMVARRLLTVARSDGLKAPVDFSLALLGDPLEHVDDSTPWTMFRIPRMAMGRQAVKLLAEILAESGRSAALGADAGDQRSVPRQVMHVILPAEFQPGETTGPARTKDGRSDA